MPISITTIDCGFNDLHKVYHTVAHTHITTANGNCSTTTGKCHSAFSVCVEFSDAAKTYCLRRNEPMETPPVLCHFTDSLQHKLDLIVLQCAADWNATIRNDIHRWATVDCGEEVLAGEGALRLLQSLINRFDCRADDSLELLTAEFSTLLALFSTHLHLQQPKCHRLQWNATHQYERRMLNLLQPLFLTAANSDSLEHSITFHRNCCLYLYTQLNLAGASAPFQETVIEYLSALLSRCTTTTNYNLVLLILRLLQSLRGSWLRVKIMVSLDTLASYFDINDLSSLYSGQIDYRRYLVGFEARWLIDNVITSHPKDAGEQQLVKMDSSKLTVQGRQQLMTTSNGTDSLVNYKPTITTVRGSSESLSYYECILLSSGFMSIGWTTKQGEFSQWRQVGADQHSVGFDGFHQCLWHDNQCDFVSNSWKAGDIIGCSVDSHKRVFTFYLNGIEVKSTTGKLSSLPYYPAVSLTKGQLCCVNFGQMPFKYSTNTAQAKSNLIAPVLLEQFYWFKDDSTELLFSDAEQQKYDQLIIDLEKNTNATSLRYQSHLHTLESRFAELIANIESSSVLRMCQAILTHMSSSITGKKTEWIRWLFIEKAVIISDSSPSAAKLSEFLYPHLKNEHSLQTIKRRNISLVLSLLIEKYGSLCSILTEEMAEFLVQIILDSDRNKLALLFAVITLNTIDLLNNKFVTSKIASFLTSEQFLAKLKKLSSYVRKIRFLNLYTLDFTQYQIACCARSVREQILTHLLSSNDLSVSSIDELDFPVKVRTTAVLSCQDLSSKVQLSPDQLSARSDRGWQTVLATVDVPKDDVFYCEIILLTSGPMRVGFVVEETMADLELPLGCNDASAICFDGFLKVIWSEKGKRWPLKKGTGKMGRWKSGDVVGCEMDLDRKKVAFFLNGKQVQIPLEATEGEFWKNDGTYRLALSLSSQQQCCCNFGQKPFRFAIA